MGITNFKDKVFEINGKVKSPTLDVNISVSKNDLLFLINDMSFEDKMDLLMELFCYTDSDKMVKFTEETFSGWKK